MEDGILVSLSSALRVAFKIEMWDWVQTQKDCDEEWEVQADGRHALLAWRGHGQCCRPAVVALCTAVASGERNGLVRVILSSQLCTHQVLTNMTDSSFCSSVLSSLNTRVLNQMLHRGFDAQWTFGKNPAVSVKQHELWSWPWAASHCSGGSGLRAASVWLTHSGDLSWTVLMREHPSVCWGHSFSWMCLPLGVRGWLRCSERALQCTVWNVWPSACVMPAKSLVLDPEKAPTGRSGNSAVMFRLIMLYDLGMMLYISEWPLAEERLPTPPLWRSKCQSTRKVWSCHSLFE